MSDKKQPNVIVIMGDDIGMWNIGAYHRGLMAGETAIRPVTRFRVDQDHYKSKIAALIDDLEPSGNRSMMHDLLNRLLAGLGPVPPDSTQRVSIISPSASRYSASASQRQWYANMIAPPFRTTGSGSRARPGGLVGHRRRPNCSTG